MATVQQRSVEVDHMRHDDPAIEIDHLVVRYGRKPAVEGLTLRAARGSVFGLLEANGAGKTSTIKTLLGFRRPSDGSAHILGRGIVRDRVEINARIGYVSETNTLYLGMTIPLLLCVLFGVVGLGVGAWQGVAAPPLGGWALSVILLWLGMLFVIGLAALYSILLPSAFAAGVLAFFTAYILTIAPVIHTGAPPHVHYFLGGPSWQLATYWSSLGIYAGVASPVKSLLIAVIAAIIPVALALAWFVRKSF